MLRAKLILPLWLAVTFGLWGCSHPPRPYFPGPGDDWQHRRPEEVGINASRLADAIRFAKENKTKWPMHPAEAILQRFADDPYREIIGPTKERGDICGLVVKNGYIVAEFGDTRRVDMAFSVTKSFLSTVAGLALAHGVLENLDRPVRETVPTEHFASEHNAQITWTHLLQQTSEWEGTLWGKPDVADRRRGRDRPLQQPGTFWEYNDVRVNLLAFALLQVWHRPLPEVLKQYMMDPIGASNTWQWHGYRNSYVEIAGSPVQSVSGGGHWGGGMWISARDMARFGYLFLRRGMWKEKQIFPEAWIDAATTPCPIYPVYGSMWWLNTEGRQWPDAPHLSYAALGAGMNAIWIYPDADLVVVIRWIDRDQMNAFLRRIVAALEPQAIAARP